MWLIGTLCPVFHVNGDDVEAVVTTLSIAVSYRQHFNRDIFIDLLGYRKYGHNEGDDPSYTQPLTYTEIKNKGRQIINDILNNGGE